MDKKNFKFQEELIDDLFRKYDAHVAKKKTQASGGAWAQ